MKSFNLVNAVVSCIVLCGTANVFAAPEAVSAAASSAATPAPSVPVEDENFCFFDTRPNEGLQYTTLKAVKYGKGTFGSVRQILPDLVRRAKAQGGEAIIGYTGSQRFGFWPWRLTRPVVRGTAIRWAEGQKPSDCQAAGGASLAWIVKNDLAPEKAQSAPGSAEEPAEEPAKE